MDNLLWKFIENFNDTFLREDFKSSKKQKSNKSSSKSSKKSSKQSSKGGVGAQHHKLSASAKAKYVSAFKNTKKPKNDSKKKSSKTSKKSSSKASKKSSKGGVGAQHHKLSASAKAKYVSAFKNTKKPKKSSKKSSGKASKKSSGKASKKSSKGGVGAQHHKLSASAKAKYVSAFENTSNNESKFIMLPKNLHLKKNSINILLPNKKI